MRLQKTNKVKVRNKVSKRGKHQDKDVKGFLLNNILVLTLSSLDHDIVKTTNQNLFNERNRITVIILFESRSRVIVNVFLLAENKSR